LHNDFSPVISFAKLTANDISYHCLPCQFSDIANSENDKARRCEGAHTQRFL